MARRREKMGQIALFNSPRLRASARTFSFGSEVVRKANSAISSEAGGKYPRYPRNPRFHLEGAKILKFAR